MTMLEPSDLTFSGPMLYIANTLPKHMISLSNHTAVSHSDTEMRGFPSRGGVALRSKLEGFCHSPPFSFFKSSPNPQGSP
jgi:hypothetical protein